MFVGGQAVTAAVLRGLLTVTVVTVLLLVPSVPALLLKGVHVPTLNLRGRKKFFFLYAEHLYTRPFSISIPYIIFSSQRSATTCISAPFFYVYELMNTSLVWL